jgi:biopolymer transport protein ExbD
MTPMVDLNFLMLMFFMFTTTFSKPNVMDLGLPAKPKKTHQTSKN